MNNLSIKCNNETEWNYVQEYLVKKNIFWNSGEKFIINREGYPIYIEIHKYSKIKKYLMFNSSYATYNTAEKTIEAKTFMRLEKLKRING